MLLAAAAVAQQDVAGRLGGGAGLVAREHHAVHAASGEAGEHRLALRAHGVAQVDVQVGPPVGDPDLAAEALLARGARVGRADEGALAHAPERPLDLALHALARDALEVGGDGRVDALGPAPGGDGAGEGVGGGGGERDQRAQGPRLVLGRRADVARHRGLAAGEGAGLVEAHHPDVGQALDRGAAAEEDAAARARGDGREHGRGDGEDERAGAHDHEEGHRAVDRAGGLRLAGREQGRLVDVMRVEQEEAGRQDDAGGVDAAPLVDQPLGGRLPRLGLADEVEDALDGALGLGTDDAPDDPARPVEGAGEELAAAALGHGHGLAGQRGLVDVRRALDQLEVGRDAVARQEQHPVARRQLADRDEGAVLAPRVGRGPGHQRVDSPAGAVHRVVLHRAGGGEEEEQEHALGPLAHRPGAGGGEEHEEMDVDPAMVPQRVPALLRRLPSARDARAEREQEDGERGRRAGLRVARLLDRQRGQPERGADRRLDRERLPAVLMPVAVRVVVRVVVSHGDTLTPPARRSTARLSPDNGYTFRRHARRVRVVGRAGFTPVTKMKKTLA